MKQASGYILVASPPPLDFFLFGTVRAVPISNRCNPKLIQKVWHSQNMPRVSTHTYADLLCVVVQMLGDIFIYSFEWLLHVFVF